MKIIRNIFASAVLLLAFAICAAAQNVNVTATGGTASATYTTLTAAFNAVNAGTHTGAITMDVAANTTEPGSAVLNSSGAGTATYTSIVIRPSADGVTISGATVTGRGLIELNGADNVTIDGDNPNSAGTNRNLTITNTAANTITYTSVIRIALAATIVTSADNDIFRNLVINGSATGRNTSATASTTGSENTTYGILAGSGASTTSATTAPSAVTSITATVTGATAANLLVDNNTITTASRGVATQGAATTVFPGLIISNNIIGNPTAGAVDGIYALGILINGSANAVASGNTIYVEGFIASSTSNVAINVGSISANTTGATIERNRINRVSDLSTSGFNAFGINLAGGNGHIVRNNFVSGLVTYATASFSTTFSAFGIRVATGTGHVIQHNSVNLSGAITGPGATLTAALCVVSTASTGMDIRNNIFQNLLTGGGTTATAHVSVYLPTSGTNAMNLTLNNNAYYTGTTANISGVAHVGTTYTNPPAGPTTYAGLYTAANFDPSNTTLTTNFRTYTSILSAAGTNDNASFASTTPAPFVSNTDLHIPNGTATKLESGGATVGILTDIDGETRPNGTAPDIGADEFVGVPAPANDIAATAFVNPVNGSTISTGASVTPQATFRNVGTAAQTNVMVQFTITGPGGYNYSNTQTIASIAVNQSVTVTFAAAPTITAGGTYTMTATVLTADSNTANDTISGSFTAVAPIPGGNINVGTGETYTSLTNNGGIFAALNAGGATGNLTINITSDLAAETGAVALNQLAGGITVLIRPTGARTISGNVVNLGLITLNGADNVTIDGLNTGGNSLLLRNTSVTTGAVVQLTNDSSNNVITNCTIEGGNTNTGSGLIFIAAGTTTGNDNNSITKNIIRSRTDVTGVPANLIVSLNASATASNSFNTINYNQLTNFINNGFAASSGATSDNWTIIGNDVSQNATRAGNTFAFNTGGMTGTNLILGNSIHGFVSSGTNAILGFLVGNSLNLSISGNRIYNFQTTAGATGVIEGLEFDGADGGTPNLTVSNNYVSLAPTIATAQVVIGIQDFGYAGNIFNAYYNTVYLGGTATGATQSWAMKRGDLAPTTYTARNNLLFNNRTGGTSNHFASGDDSANTGTFASNYNFFAGTGATPANFMDYGTAATGTPVTFAAWQAGPPARDANSTGNLASSFNVSDIFVDAANGNLHLKPTAPASIQNAGNPVAGITIDLDNENRDAATPDIGADEYLGTTAAAVSIRGRVLTNGGRGLVNARVELTGADGKTRTVLTTAFGNFTINDVDSGTTYIINVSSKRFTFAPQVLSPTDNISDLTFTAQ